MEMKQMKVTKRTSKINKLLTYNLFMRPPGIKTNQDDFKNERFQKLKQYILKFDIICFQELFSAGNFRKQNLIQFAILNQYFYWQISQPPSFFSGSIIDAGLAVISKFPIVSAKFQSYKIGILSDSASDKGSLYCKILVNNCTLHLFNTHLQASYQNSEQPQILSIITRLKQFQKLVFMIEQTLIKQDYCPQDLVLIAGDLNTDARKTYYDLDFSQVKQFIDNYKIKSSQFNEYNIMKQILKNNNKNSIIDLAFENYQQHPITFGEDQQILTGLQDVHSNQRLDYIIELIPDKCRSLLKVNTKSCLHPQFSQLSDHYGLSVELIS